MNDQKGSPGFDGADARFRNSSGHDATGRFIPYLVRVKDEIIPEPVPGQNTPDDEDYYPLSKRREKFTIVAPFLYPVGGVEMILYSFVAPIMRDGRFAGIDVAIDSLQKPVTEKRKSVRLASLSILSPGGVVAANAGDSGRIGKFTGTEIVDGLEIDWSDHGAKAEVPELQRLLEALQTTRGSLQNLSGKFVGAVEQVQKNHARNAGNGQSAQRSVPGPGEHVGRNRLIGGGTLRQPGEHEGDRRKHGELSADDRKRRRDDFGRL